MRACLSFVKALSLSLLPQLVYHGTTLLAQGNVPLMMECLQFIQIYIHPLGSYTNYICSKLLEYLEQQDHLEQQALPTTCTLGTALGSGSVESTQAQTSIKKRHCLYTIK